MRMLSTHIGAFLLLGVACSSSSITNVAGDGGADVTGGTKSTGTGTSASVGGSTQGATLTAVGTSAIGGNGTVGGATNNTLTPSGGAVSTGGANSSTADGGNGAGGLSATQTNAPIGGASPMGGAAAGGAAAGGAATGGAATGGAATGGAATGGTATGGAATGGTATGGAATGGAATGGAATGGAATGGAATGGAATGGAATGGAATGGAATGGAATGGAATGGAATGGAATGGAPCQVTEICDGLDNDCDGIVDLSDGLTLSGTNISDPHRKISTAWSSSTGKFVMTGADAASLYFGTLSTAGTPTWNSTPFSTYTVSAGDFSPPSIAWAPAWSTFGVAFHVAGYMYQEAQIDLMSTTGTGTVSTEFQISTVPGAAEPALAARATGDLMITLHDSSATYIGRVDPDVGYRPGATINEIATRPRIATSGDLSAIVYQVKNSSTIDWVRANASIIVPSGYPEQLGTGANPAIATTHSGTNYAIAWATASGFNFQIMKASNGTTVCGPLSVAFGNGALDVNDAVAVASTQYGNLVLISESAWGIGAAKLFRISDSCTLIDSATVKSGTGSISAPGISVGGGYTALSWAEETSEDGYLSYTRVLRDGLCN